MQDYQEYYQTPLGLVQICAKDSGITKIATASECVDNAVYSTAARIFRWLAQGIYTSSCIRGNSISKESVDGFM